MTRDTILYPDSVLIYYDFADPNLQSGTFHGRGDDVGGSRVGFVSVPEQWASVLNRVGG